MADGQSTVIADALDKIHKAVRAEYNSMDRFLWSLFWVSSACTMFSGASLVYFRERPGEIYTDATSALPSAGL